MDSKELLQMVQNFGAPTILAVLIIFRVERRLDTLIRLLHELPRDIADHVACPYKKNPRDEEPHQ